MEPTHDALSRKRPVNLTLNADLVDRVHGTTDNLSAVVEKLLADYLEQQRQARLDRLGPPVGSLALVSRAWR